MKNKCPCHNCPDRYVGCHSLCERYKAFREEIRKLNEKINKVKEADRIYDSYVYDNCSRNKWRKNK